MSNDYEDDDKEKKKSPKITLRASIPGVEKSEDLREDPENEVLSDKKDGGLRVTRLLVGGVEIDVLEDKLGNVWNVPADGQEDHASALNGTLMDKIIPHFDPAFHYELHHRNKVPDKLLDGFVIVSKAEVKFPTDLVMEYGKPVSSQLAIEDAVLMKIPKVIADRRYSAKDRAVQEALREVKPTEEMLERARQKGAPIMKSLRELQKAATAKGGVVQQEVSRRVSEKIRE